MQRLLLEILTLLILGIGTLALAENSAIGLPAPAATATPQATPQDRGFVEQFITAALAAIETGALAGKQARDAEVRSFAQRLQSEFQAVHQRLASLAAPLNLPPLPESPDAEHKALADQLAQASRRDFDRLFIAAQQRDAEALVSLLEMEIDTGGNEELRKFAADVLPMVREHRQRANQLADALKSR